RLAEAAEHFSKSLNYNPNAPDAQNNLGAVLVRLGHPQEALEHLKAALRLKPNYPEAQDQLGGAYVKLGRMDMARIHYTEAVRLRPDFAHAHLKLVLIEAGEAHLEPAVA